MKVKLQQVSPAQIEARSMEIISQELGERHFAPLEEQVIKRVIHTTADFDYADSLTFSPGAVQQGIRLHARDAEYHGEHLPVCPKRIGPHNGLLDRFGQANAVEAVPVMRIGGGQPAFDLADEGAIADLEKKVCLVRE